MLKLGFESMGTIVICLCCLLYGLLGGNLFTLPPDSLHDRWEWVGRRLTHVHVTPLTRSSALMWAGVSLVGGVQRRISYVVSKDVCTSQVDNELLPGLLLTSGLAVQCLSWEICVP